MPRPRWFRVAAFLLALLTSVTTPGLAFAHARAHAHLASEHGEAKGGIDRTDTEHDRIAEHAAADHAAADIDDHHDGEQQDAGGGEAGHGAALAPSIDMPSHGHAHEHPSIAAAATAPREGIRFGDAEAVRSPTACVSLARFAYQRIPCAVAPTSALLARPGPDSGPPPSPRAPPAH